ncbi:SDR family oxidoreductase [Martelella endophytica]|uniref:Nucleoside-diphosphate sugar epimerase n=1 Tax=Martelella endophytica TaxID=1486262 RepID=A0A0D5LSI6_MAREN|nr:SDR family oxidoreductase [Martelella endophytica]AJY46742.1 nucleoside-diphosphate sugar epimerase [Martelella endophytica]
MNHQTVLVTGASGKLGCETLDFLLQAGKKPSEIIATTRDVSKLADYAAKGIAVRQADFDAPETLAAAFAGADRVAIISTDSLAPEVDRVAQHTSAVNAAKAAGATHVVYTSLPGAEDSLISFAGDHLGTEQAIKASGLNYTLLRNAWYQENLFMSLPSAFQHGVWLTAAGNGRINYIAHEDCARALAAALLSDTSGKDTYTLVGPTTYTIDEVAALAHDSTGKPLEVRHVTSDALRETLSGVGLPPFVVDLMVSTDENIRSGRFDIVNNDFEKLTGRKPKPLEVFFEENAKAF